MFSTYSHSFNAMRYNITQILLKHPQNFAIRIENKGFEFEIAEKIIFRVETLTNAVKGTGF